MRVILIGAIMMSVFAAALPAQEPAARQQLLPTGALRVGINANNQLTRVVGREIATELARRLGADAVFIDYPSPGATADAVGTGWDIGFIAADPEREAAIAFTPPYVELDATYLVTTASPVHTSADIDRPGVRIATGATSAFTLVLKRQLKNAELVFLSNDEGAKAVAGGAVHAMAGLRFDLLARSVALPNTRVLPDTFARAQQAVGLPKANTAALAFVSAFLADVKRSGLVSSAIARTGLPGAHVVP
jgi:polar amino acid transport system substrate-binding protein